MDKIGGYARAQQTVEHEATEHWKYVTLYVSPVFCMVKYNNTAIFCMPQSTVGIVNPGNCTFY